MVKAQAWERRGSSGSRDGAQLGGLKRCQGDDGWASPWRWRWEVPRALGAVTLRSRPPRGPAPPDHGPTRGSQYPGAHMVTLRAGIHSGPSLLGPVPGGEG